MTLKNYENKVIQIRGANGSGKTTVAKALIAQKRLKESYVLIGGEKVPVYTDDGNHIFLIGNYGSAACGGCDSSIRNKEHLLAVLHHILKNCKPKTVVFEGLIYGKTVLLAENIKKMCNVFGYEFYAFCLVAELNVLFDRVMKRNGGKRINETAFYNTYKSVINSANTLQRKGYNVIFINTETKDVLQELIRLMENE